nr:MAG TPA: hypothetical protein [Caudoviricetes sp.]
MGGSIHRNLLLIDRRMHFSFCLFHFKEVLG